MSKTLSALTEATTVATTDIFAMVVGANSRKVTLANAFKAFNLVSGTNVLELRNGASAQALRVYNTYTDASNYERGVARWSSNVFEIGVEAAGTGTARTVRLTNGGSNFQINGSGGVSTILATSTRFDLYLGSVSGSAFVVFSGGGTVYWRFDSNGLLMAGGTTSSFPALKRSSADLQVRLADDSAFAVIQGKLKTHANAVAETPSATHTIEIQDASGASYKVLALAA